MPEDKRFEQVTLYTPGPIPGLPGDHAPGVYQIDWQERTLTPVYATQPLQGGDLQAGEAPQPAVAQEIAHLEEELHTLEAPQQPQA